VVVTGMGVVSSIGNNTQEVLASLRDGKSGIVRAEEYAKLGFRCQVHGAVEIEWEPMVPRKPRRFMETGVGWNYIAMDQAIRDAGLEPGEVVNERTGIIMGSGGPSTRAIVRAADVTREKDPRKVGPFEVPKGMCSGPSAALATAFQIKGVNYSISSACATSAHCIGNAAEMIQWGKQDVMFAGGCEELDWTLSVLFDSMGAMSTRFNDTPARASRAYDKDRDGFVIAGGAGVVVLEELERAMVAPSGEGAERCMRMALNGRDGKGVGRVGYINSHGTATPVGDKVEVEAIREAFGKDIPPISSTKSLAGHSLGAAGVQEAIFSLLMMNNGFVCASANIDTLDPDFEGVPIATQRHDTVSLDCVMSNSFGFGGTNATLVFRRHDA
jgi:3-oxoacyl-[acyl-carrier-protein] synthase-1